MKYLRSGVVFVLLVAAAAAVSARGRREEPPMLINLAQFQEMLRAGDVVVLDIREPDSYIQGHIPGAVFVQYDAVEAAVPRIRSIGGARYVTYCACPAEELSMSAALTLRRRGVGPVYVLVGGYDAWIRGGNPVVRGRNPY